MAELKGSHSPGGSGLAGKAAQQDPRQKLASESTSRIYLKYWIAKAGSSDTQTLSSEIAGPPTCCTRFMESSFPAV